MEADSTTYEKNSEDLVDSPNFPFSTLPGNYKLYQELMTNTGDRIFEAQLVDKLQNLGLLPKTLKCLSNKPECKLNVKQARVVDRLQWACESCGKRQPIREGSFFLRLQCSIQQVLQMVFAWCEDADCFASAEHFGVKSKVAYQIFEKLDDLACREYDKLKLGGDNAVVLAEIYPDCLTRLSPDTTDQPHVHRILMLADTKHIPTYYRLEILKEDLKKTNNDAIDEMIKCQIEDIIKESVADGSMIVTGSNVPSVENAVTIQQLSQHCDVDMQHFLSTRIWRQAITLCSASREVCGSAVARRYLHSAAYRVRHTDGFYAHVLEIIATHYTRKCDT